MFSKKPIYRSPGGAYYKLYMDMAQQPHLLIAGATGSGKSVIINGIIYTQLLRCPDKAGFVLIDPKKVELSMYKDTPHCIMYSDENSEHVKALQAVIKIMDRRYSEMQAARVRKYTGSAVYVIIDELADLLTTDKKTFTPLIQRIAQLGRAANIHLIMATQRPTTDIISRAITCNIDARVGLRTENKRDSVNILGSSGCELLPRYGQAFYKTADGLQLYNVPMYTDDQIETLVNYWTGSACRVA